VSDPRYRAITIAKWFVEWAQVTGEELSNVKLQGLLHYAQVQFRARYGEPLFSDDIEAGPHGPVVAEVHQVFKEFGARPVELADSDPFRWSDVSPAVSDFLSAAWNSYGSCPAGRLPGMTHDEAPRGGQPRRRR
jgi:uncharacterized phage-associated protein